MGGPLQTVVLLGAAWYITACPCWADDKENRFLEFPGTADSVTYDLATVNVLQPGRFTIIETRIDNPDVMRFELKVLSTLRTYCKRPDGRYPAPADIFTLGSADMPVEDVVVETVQTKTYSATQRTKTISWDYPYKKLAINTSQGEVEKPFIPIVCDDGEKEYFEMYNVMTNGTHAKYLYDCKRGLEGIYINEQDEKPRTFPVRKDTYAYDYYLSVCFHVTHEAPYLPE
jgi:hypothetical protein